MNDAGVVAILGTGRMGAAMARTLRRAGFEVIVYNRTSATAEAVAAETGATVADNARTAVGQASIVIVMLADDASVIEVMAASIDGLAEGAVVVQMSTIDPSTLSAIQPGIEAAGAMLLDAPVSGSVQLVDEGGLTILVGGDGDALDRARPVLDTLAATILHLGDVGAGATMKLAVNSMIHSINVALSEALVLAEKSGVERARAYEVFASSAAAAPFVHYKRAAFEDPDASPVAFNLDLVAKDLDLILGLAEQVGAVLDQGQVNQRVVRQAIAAGLGDEDMSAIATYLRRADEG